MSGIKNRLLENHLKNMREYRSRSESDGQSSVNRNIDTVRSEISDEIVKLKSALFELFRWTSSSASPKTAINAKELISQIKIHFRNSSYYYTNTELSDYVNLELYIDDSTSGYISIFESLYNDYFDTINKIEIHSQNRSKIVGDIKLELLNGREELTKGDIEAQKQSAEYHQKSTESEAEIKNLSEQLQSLNQQNIDLASSSGEEIVNQKKDLKSTIRKIEQNLKEFLVDLTCKHNPQKIYINPYEFQNYLEKHQKYIEYNEVKKQLEDKKRDINNELIAQNKSFVESIESKEQKMSNIKDKYLKLRLAKKSSKISKTPSMPFREYSKYISSKSFPILPGYIFKNVVNDRNPNDTISKEEESQFFEDALYEVECGEFGKVCFSTKIENEQKFINLELFGESVKLIDYDYNYDCPIINCNGKKYRLNFEFVKYFGSGTIKFNLLVDNTEDYKDTLKFQICTKKTIPGPLFPEFSSTILK